MHKIRKMRLLLTTLLLVVTGCGSGDDASPAIDRRCVVLPGEDVPIGKSAPSNNYFPVNFGKPAQVCDYKGYPECFPTIGEVEKDWYPRHWQAADEPSLYELSNAPAATGTTTLRFTWLPTFHHPVIVRIERSGKKAQLIAKQLSGQGGDEPGIVEREFSRPLSTTEIAKLNAILSSTKVLGQRATECNGGVDGSQWIVEGIDRNGYHYVNRWSPEDGPVRAFVDFALLLTGWTFEERYETSAFCAICPPSTHNQTV